MERPVPFAKMASLLQSELVSYLVRGEKEIRAPLSQLYFCRYCSELRSLECVSHEVKGGPGAGEGGAGWEGGPGGAPGVPIGLSLCHSWLSSNRLSFLFAGMVQIGS